MDALPRSRLLGAQPGIVHHGVEMKGHSWCDSASNLFRMARSRGGHRRDEIAAAELQRVHADLGGGEARPAPP